MQTAALAWPGDTLSRSRHLPRDGAVCQGPHSKPGLFPARKEKHLPQDSTAQQQEVYKGDKAGALPGTEFTDATCNYCDTSTCRAPLGNGNPAQNWIHPSRLRKNKPLPLMLQSPFIRFNFGSKQGCRGSPRSHRPPWCSCQGTWPRAEGPRSQHVPGCSCSPKPASCRRATRRC